MRLLFASSEIYPLAKTGGLADVSAGLPLALSRLGVDVRLVLPGYPGAIAAAAGKIVRCDYREPCGGFETRLIEARTPDSGLPVWLVDAPALFDRGGGLYCDGRGADWPDNAARFAHFSRVVAQLACGELVPDWKPDVVHCNDWHTGLVPLYLTRAADRPPATVMTIHNLAYQGLFPPSSLSDFGIPPDVLTPEGIEFYEQISFLKAGIRYADHITTVSPSYAREILTAEHGCGLEGLLRERMDRLTGILNGVDQGVWNPETDTYLPANFGPGDISGKRACKAELRRELGLEVESDAPLAIFLSRITDQKMAGSVLDALPAILERGVQFALLGEGNSALEERFQHEARQHGHQIAVHIGYEEPLAHRMHAGGDILLHPSLFEPCGLTQLYALRYATLPIVRNVGGLADTVVDADELALRGGTATGFVFDDPETPALVECLDRALQIHDQPVQWRKMQRQAMTSDFSWDASAEQYLSIYRSLAAPERLLLANATHASATANVA